MKFYKIEGFSNLTINRETFILSLTTHFLIKVELFVVNTSCLERELQVPVPVPLPVNNVAKVKRFQGFLLAHLTATLTNYPGNVTLFIYSN